MTSQLKVALLYFPAVLCIILFKVVLTFEPENEILKCELYVCIFDHEMCISCRFLLI